MLLFRKLFVCLLFLVSCLFVFHSKSNSDVHITKKYFNNIFAGGKERIFVDEENRKQLEIENASIYITLFDNYSKINASYSIINNGEDCRIKFAFPRLDAIIDKTFANKNLREKSIATGEYTDFTFNIDGNEAAYEIIRSDDNEINLPYKIGDLEYIYNTNNAEYKFIEQVNSYSYLYLWYVADIDLKHNEKTIVNVEYITPHYFNFVDIDGLSELDEQIEGIEDPALNYNQSTADNRIKLFSEKVMVYLLNTIYSDQEYCIDSLYIKLTCRIINQKYLKVLPANYKKKGINYTWKYDELKAKPLNNIIVKLSPVYYDAVCDALSLSMIPEKKKDGFRSYYELDKNNNELIIYKNDGGKIAVRSIRLAFDYFENKHELKNMNKPMDIDIYFSGDADFSNYVVYNWDISSRRLRRKLYKYNYVTIFKSKGINCRYIKLKINRSSSDIDTPIRLNDIQLIK